MKFSHLLGNEPIKVYLSRAIDRGELHHTLLFSGAEGIGKSLFAKALARELLDASMERVTNENHPDLHVLRPEGKSGTHLIEHLREMIDEMHKPPFAAKRKVFIICEAERMLVAAANVLLKTLEEPDLDSQTILLTSAPNEILPTILSRCVQLAFQPLPQDLIATFIVEKHAVSRERAEMLARLSNGSLGHAVRLVQNDRSEKTGQILFDALEEKIPSTQAINEIDAILSDLEGVEFHKFAEHLLAVYLMWVRDAELQLAGGDEKLFFFPQKKKRMISLKSAEEKAATVKLALERNIKLSACLDYLLS